MAFIPLKFRFTAFFILALILLPYKTILADSGIYTVQQNCEITIYYGFNLLDSMPAISAGAYAHVGTYPVSLHALGGSGGYQATYWYFLDNAIPYLISSTTQSATYDGLAWGDYLTYGSGDRWAYTINIPDGQPQTIYKWTINGGLCTEFSNYSPPLTTNPADNSFITITKPTPYGVTLPVGVIDTRAYFYFDVAQSTTTKTVIEVYDAVTNELQHTSNLIVPAGSTINFEMPVNFTMATGSKKVIASYRVASNNQDLLIPAEGFFNVGTNTYLMATGLETPQAVPAGLTQIECSTFDVGCQFQKAMVFVFVPSQSVLNKFSTLWQELKYLKPFGYISVTYDQLKNVSASSTSAYTLPTIPFIDTIFTPLKSAMAVMLWGVFAFVFYHKRLKNIDI